MAERKIDQTFYDRWRKRHKEAAVSMVSRDEMLEAIYEEIECDMQLVGVSAIEDKLAVRFTNLIFQKFLIICFF